MCDSNFWLELNYLEVAKAAQSCSAHFTALLYTEIYVDKIKANMEESRRYAKGFELGDILKLDQDSDLIIKNHNACNIIKG